MGAGEGGVLGAIEGRVDVLAVCEFGEFCVFGDGGGEEFGGRVGWAWVGGLYEFVCCWELMGGLGEGWGGGEMGDGGGVCIGEHYGDGSALSWLGFEVVVLNL